MIRLTDKGWTGSAKGKWSSRADRVRERSGGILVSRRRAPNSRTGADIITGATNRGVGIQMNGSLRMGAGDDILLGRSRKGDGISTQGNLNRDLANAQGSLSMGLGNDLIVGSGREEGIRNEIVIDLGDGNDEVDASRGGLGGGGVIRFGTGNDTLRGFGQHEAWGETGRDTVLLPEGSYTISRATRGFDSFIISQHRKTLFLESFERVGSNLTEDTLGLKHGTLLVAANGNVSYI